MKNKMICIKIINIWTGRSISYTPLIYLCIYKTAMMALDSSPELRLAMKVMASVELEMQIKDFSCFGSGSHFVQIWVEGHSRNVSMKLF